MNTPSVELLEDGKFFIVLDSQTKVPGCFAMRVLDRFCDDKNLESYFQLSHYVATGMRAMDYALLVLRAIEYHYPVDSVPCPYSLDNVTEWIEKMGGVAGKGTMELFSHAMGRVLGDKYKTALKKIEEQEKNEEKKSQQAAQ